MCLAVLLAAVPQAFGADSKWPCAPRDMECANRVMGAHPAKKLSFWKRTMSERLGRRIAAGEPEVVEFLTFDNYAHDFPERPRRASPAPELVEELRTALDELPDSVKRLVDSKLAGIRLVEDIGGTGFTDEVLDDDGKPVAAFVVLDPNVLSKRSANEWASWKERSPFRPDSRFQLDATIEDAQGDTRKNAIQYILLHELGHVISVGERFHPRWTVPVKKITSTNGYRFFELSWAIDPGRERYASRFDDAFPDRRHIVYYFGAKLDGAVMPAVYSQLTQTNFPTLYAATSPGDDFAESFANFVHTKLMGKRFEIRIRKDQETILVYGACWDEQRCAAKRTILEAFLKAH